MMHQSQSAQKTMKGSAKAGDDAAANNQIQNDSAEQLVYVISIILGLVTTAAILVWVLMLARRGIDFSDEGYYLNFISNPGIYSASVTQFGFFYNPLFELLNENIERLRQLTVGMTMFLASTLAFVLSFRERLQRIEKQLERVAVAVIISSSVVSFFSASLTPSYNTMTLQALLVASIGILLASNSNQQISRIDLRYLGWGFIALGGTIAFLSKPTSAVALAMLTFVFLLVVRKLDLRGVLIAIIIASLLILGFAISADGSLTIFYQRLSDGLLIMQSLQSPYHEGILRFESFILSAREGRLFIAIIVVLAFVTAVATSKHPLLQGSALALPIVIFLVELALALGVFPIPISQIAIDPKVMLAIPLASFLAWVLVLGRDVTWNSFGSASAFSVCLLAMPYVFAIGSGNNYWTMGGFVAVFWALAALPWLKSISPRSGSLLHVLPAAALSQLIGFVSLYASSEAPYRQPVPLLQNRERVSIRGGTLLLGPNYATYLQDLERISNAAGFTLGTPVIDLTGTSAASLFAMRAKAIGQPWLIGGYPGSERFAVLSLLKVPCRDLKAAWLLTEPEGPRRLPDGVLKQLNLDLDRDYMVVGQTLTPARSSGYDSPRLQVLMKPKSHEFSDVSLLCAAESR